MLLFMHAVIKRSYNQKMHQFSEKKGTYLIAATYTLQLQLLLLLYRMYPFPPHLLPCGPGSASTMARRGSLRSRGREKRSRSSSPSPPPPTRETKVRRESCLKRNNEF